MTTEGGTLEIVRIVLSGVARAKGRCGKQLLAQMLCGSTSEKVTRNRLNRLSTFGLLGHWKQTDAVELIDALVAARYLEQVDVDRFRPVLQLTPRGQEVMAGRVDQIDRLSLAAGLADKLRRGLPGAKARPEQTARTATAPVSAVPVAATPPAARADRPAAQVVPTPPAPAVRPMPQREPALSLDWEAIEEASEDEPSFDEIAAAQPSRPPASSLPAADAATVPSTAAAAQVATAVVPGPNAAPAPPAAGQPNHYWTWRLLAAGFSADDCTAIRGIDRDLVLDHALRAVDSGWAVEPQWLLEPALIASLAALVGDERPERIRPLLAKLPRGTRYEEVQLYLKCHFPGPVACG